jgi:hypothetical protein
MKQKKRSIASYRAASLKGARTRKRMRDPTTKARLDWKLYKLEDKEIVDKWNAKYGEGLSLFQRIKRWFKKPRAKYDSNWDG